MEEYLIPFTNACTLVALSYIALKIRNRVLEGTMEWLAVPLLTGLSAVLMMLLPMPTELIIKDLRIVPIMMTGLKFGWPMALLSTLLPGLYTVWLHEPYWAHELLDGLLLPALICGLLHRREEHTVDSPIPLARGAQAISILFVLKIATGLMVTPLPWNVFLIMNLYMLCINATCVLALILMYNDEHNRWLQHRQLELEANQDRLTMLPNLRGFTEIASGMLQKRPISVLMIDIDNFKTYNDSLGHLQGDWLLREVGQLLRQSVGEQDYVARYGGEEFVVMCHTTDVRRLALLAHRLCRAVEQYPFLGRECQPSGTISISVGVAMATHTGEELQALLSKADQALYASKNNGKNRFTFYELPAALDEMAAGTASAAATRKLH